jgi:hypothetical protein
MTDNVVVVTEPIPNIVVAPVEPIIEISSSGAPGPAGRDGDPGPAGPAGGTFTYDQPFASDTWIIAHNLNFAPNVTVVDSTGQEVEGDITYTDLNNLTITFSSAFSGTAYLS